MVRIRCGNRKAGSFEAVAWRGFLPKPFRSIVPLAFRIAQSRWLGSASRRRQDLRKIIPAPRAWHASNVDSTVAPPPHQFSQTVPNRIHLHEQKSIPRPS